MNIFLVALLWVELFHYRRYATKKLKNALSKYFLPKPRSRVSPSSQINPRNGTEKVSKNKMAVKASTKPSKAPEQQHIVKFVYFRNRPKKTMETSGDGRIDKEHE